MPRVLQRNDGLKICTASDPMTVATAVRDAVRQTDPSNPLADMKTQGQQIAETMAKPRKKSVRGAGDSLRLIRLLLACIGLMIVSYETVRRTHEIGFEWPWERAGPTFSALVMRQTVVVVTIGAGIGVASRWPRRG